MYTELPFVWGRRMIVIDCLYWILLSLDNLLQKCCLGLPLWMLCAGAIGWTWKNFDSQASNPQFRESWVRVSALHRNVAMDYLSFKQVHVHALNLFLEGFCCSCVRGWMHKHGLHQGVIACTRIIFTDMGQLKCSHYGRPGVFDKLWQLLQ